MVMEDMNHFPPHLLDGDAQTVAIKVMFKEELEHAQAGDLLRHEFETHCRLVHPRILRVYGYFHDVQRGKETSISP